MTLYILICGLYYLSVGFLLLRGRKEHPEGALSEAAFLSRAHTDSMKGIAALGIVVSHLAERLSAGVSGPMKLLLWFGTSLGGFGVNLFFFASGFGNYYSTRKLQNSRQAASWLGKRVANILIAYLVCFTLAELLLRLLGYRAGLRETGACLLSLKMPMSVTWYLKIQLLLYGVLVLSLLVQSRAARAAIIIGLSFALALGCYTMGFRGQWWKSTMCFCVGYFAAEYKSSVFQFLSAHQKQAWRISLVCFAVLFVAVNPFDNFVVKVLGNGLLLLSTVVLAELAGLDNAALSKAGGCSLELYLIHIAFSAWFLGANTPSNFGVMLVVAVTAVLSVAARYLNRKLTIK